MNQYKLTFTVTLEEQDDPAARKKAKEIAEAVNGVIENAEISLKQVFRDKPPRGIQVG